jgi:hypothetical protein
MLFDVVANRLSSCCCAVTARYLAVSLSFLCCLASHSRGLPARIMRAHGTVISNTTYVPEYSVFFYFLQQYHHRKRLHHPSIIVESRKTSGQYCEGQPVSSKESYSCVNIRIRRPGLNCKCMLNNKSHT